MHGGHMIADRTHRGLPAHAARSIVAPASSRDCWWQLALFLLLTIGRMLNIVFQRRFWAEEGTVFYWHAATTAWLPALFYSYAGYMNFGANIAAVAARHLVPLDYAPRITFVFALAAQICPAILLLTSRAAWLRSRLTLAASLLLLVGAPAAEEIWLNTIHSQFYLALCTGLILTLETESGGREIFRRFLLFFAPLYGLVAIIFLPLFILRTLIERSHTRLIQALVLASGSTIQLLGFCHADARPHVFDIKLGNSRNNLRQEHIRPLSWLQRIATSNSQTRHRAQPRHLAISSHCHYRPGADAIVYLAM
jgi:hypothetical protein